MKGNHLSFENQCRIVHALAEGASIRSVEQQTKNHRDSIMRLGTRVGKGCAIIHDELMRDLPCKEIQIDEMWSFCGKKQKWVTPEEDAAGLGDRWIYIAIDPDSKVVPSYAVGKRDFTTTYRFGHDLASRMGNRVQLTSDGMNEYISVVEDAFGSDGVDYAMLVKSYTHEKYAFAERKSSPPPMTSARPRRICGEPDPDKISTSHVEARNMSVRNLLKRVARLTVCYSKKPENMDAAVALNMVYYNFVRPHTTIKMTPAMALGIQPSFWSIEEFVDRALKKCPITSND
jgi:IS1 family transposase